MGENLPTVGELVAYYIDSERSVFAEVVHVWFWDLVDIRLPSGELIREVRRVLDWGNGAPLQGRFRRTV